MTWDEVVAHITLKMVFQEGTVSAWSDSDGTYFVGVAAQRKPMLRYPREGAPEITMRLTPSGVHRNDVAEVLKRLFPTAKVREYGWKQFSYPPTPCSRGWYTPTKETKPYYDGGIGSHSFQTKEEYDRALDDVYPRGSHARQMHDALGEEYAGATFEGWRGFRD